MGREKKKQAGKVLSTIYAAFIYAFIYIPIIVMIAFSFNDQSSNTHWVGFTGKYYLQLFKDRELMQVFGTTLLLAFSSASLALVIGTLGALALCRYQFKGKSVICYAMFIPLVVPEVVIAVALISVMSLIGFPRGYAAVLFGHVTLVLPYMILSVKTSLSDYKISIEEASLDLGASRKETFFRITLPLIMPGVMSGAFLAFTLSLDDLVITDFLAGPRMATLPVKVYSLVKIGVSPEINALYTIIVLFIAVTLVARKAISSKKRRKNIFTLLLLCSSICMTSCSKDESLRILTYPEFLPQELVDAFEAEYGISVAVDYCNTEEELLTKWMIDKGGAGYDMSVPYTGSLQALRESGTIQELNFTHIPNYQYLTEESLLFDNPKDIKYAVPYMTMSGYEWLYNPSRCPIELKVLEDLTNPALKNQIVLAPSAQVWINRALLHLGYESNSSNEAEISAAVEWLKKMKPNIKVFDGAKPSTSLLNGECSIALTYSSDAAETLYQYPDIKVLKLDDYQFRTQTQVFCIADKTDNKEKAELFINWIHEPKNYAFCLDKYPYMSCNYEALKYTGKKYNSIRYLFDIPKGSPMFHNQDLGDAIILYDKYWSSFMSY